MLAMDWLSRHKRIAALGLLVLLAGIFIYVGNLQEAALDEAEDIAGYGGPHSDDAGGSRTLFHKGVPIGGRKHGETYGDYNNRRAGASADNFFGFGCLKDCTHHMAGYQWAYVHDVKKPKQCVGDSWGFVEGCAVVVLQDERAAP
jgi:hypothetical protein